MKDYIPLIDTAVWAALILVIVLFFGSEIKQRMRQGGAVKVGPVEFGELKAKVDEVQDDVSDLNNKVTQLFLHTMSHGMYENLKKIASGHFGEYVKGAALDRELRFLRDYGFIEVGSISSIPGEGPNLSDYVSATEPGKNFVELREHLPGNN
jgi:hypothetical protein